MGGVTSATTVSFHHPDMFAGVTSFFGDSKYDLSTYVRSILGNEAGAHQVNALDVVDNARYLPVVLIHGEEDRTSTLAQSELLAKAMNARGYQVSVSRVAGAGHEGALVARYIAEVVARARTARAPDSVPRVTYSSVNAGETSLYGGKTPCGPRTRATPCWTLRPRRMEFTSCAPRRSRRSHWRALSGYR